MKNNPILKAIIYFALVVCLIMPLRSADAAHEVSLPAFSGFVASLVDGRANVVRGVYVPEVLALQVMQQPAGDNASVLRLDGVVTQFRAAAQNHVIGLLAHVDMAGASFAGLQIAQEVRIVYGNGRVDYYSVNRLASFEALQSGGEVNNYMDINSNATYTVQDIFTMFYTGAGHVTFQTCINKDGNPSWGRFFVTAIPIPVMDYLHRAQTLGINFRLDPKEIQLAFNLLNGDFNFP